MAKNTLVYLFKVYLMAVSSSNYMVLNDIIILKFERMWKEAVVTYMMRDFESHSCNYEEYCCLRYNTIQSDRNLFMCHR